MSASLPKLVERIAKMDAECKQHQRIHSSDVQSLMSLMVLVLKEIGEDIEEANQDEKGS